MFIASEALYSDMAQSQAIPTDAQDRESVYTVVHEDGPETYLKSFGRDEDAANALASEAGEEFQVQRETGGKLLPVTGRGRRKKAKREGWSNVGDFRARFPSREKVLWRIPGDSRRQPRKVRVRYDEKCGHWRAETTRGEWDEYMSELERGSFESALEAARSFMVPSKGLFG